LLADQTTHSAVQS